MPASGDDEARGGAPTSNGDRAPGSFSVPPPVPPGFWSPGPLETAHRWVPATRNDAGWWLVFAGTGFIVGQLVALVAISVAAGVTGNSGHLTAIGNLAAPPAWYIGSGLVGLWIGFLVAAVLASRVRGTKQLAADLGIAFRPADILGILIGIGGQLLVTLLYLPFISHLKDFQAPTTKLTGGAHGASFAVIAILTVLGAPFFEELFFRGVLFRGLLGFFGVGPTRVGQATAKAVVIGAAIVVDGLLFALAHAEVEQLAGLAVFGCILAFVAFKTQRLGMNMVAHATFNLVAVIAIVSSRGGVVH